MPENLRETLVSCIRKYYFYVWFISWCAAGWFYSVSNVTYQRYPLLMNRSFSGNNVWEAVYSFDPFIWTNKKMVWWRMSQGIVYK